MMMLAGVDVGDITEVRNPYIAPEILRNYDGSKTVIVFAVSQKDMDEDPRFSFRPTKIGKPSYLQPYKEGAKLKPFGDPDRPTGYVVVTPTFQFDVLGEPMKSATEVRKQFANADTNTQKEIIKDLFGSYDKSIHTLMNKKLKASQTSVSKIRSKAKTIKEQLHDHGDLTHEKFGPMLDAFVSFASDKLGIKSFPKITLRKEEMPTSFGGYNPSDNSIVIVTKNRHPMDIYRTVAHELVHHKQKEEGRIGKNISQEGSTGSPQENEANAEAGKIMRWFAKSNPEMFKAGYVVEGMTTSGGIRGLGNVTGEVSPSTVSQYVLDNQGYEYPQLQDNTTNGLYTFTDNNYWLDKDGSKKYKTKSIVQEENLEEGIYDPARHTAVFLAGGPGSGKDFVLQRAVAGHGHTELNSDRAFEHLMGKRGLDKKMPDYEEPQRNLARGRAKEIYGEKERLAIGNRQGLVINGTADDPQKIGRMKKRLEGLGYKTMMVFVNASNEVSRARNIQRGVEGGREVPENIRQEKWNRSQQAHPVYQEMFGNDYVAVDNSDDYRRVGKKRKQEIDDQHTTIYNKVGQFSATPSDHPAAVEWEQREAQKRGITDYRRARAQNVTNPIQHTRRQPANIAEEKGSLSLKNWFDKSRSKDGKKGWVQVGGRYDGKPCARQPGQTSSPKCRSSSERASMTKKEREYAFKKKQREDPNQPEKSGAARPTMVKTYKNQQESIQMDKKTIQEIKDACYHKVKARYKVWPSAYASGALVKCRKKGASNWGNKSKVNEAFETFFEEHGAGDFGTDKLRLNYQMATPGQAPGTKAPEKKKKKLAQEDNNLPRYGLPADGIGPETTQYRPMTVSGFGGAWTAGISESVLKWANNPTTQRKFIDKYGDLAEQKLNEAVERLGVLEDNDYVAKTVNQIRESYSAASYGKDPTDTMSPIGVQNKDDVRQEENLVHRKYKVKKKLAEGSAAWTRKEGKNPEGGLNKKGIESYRLENPGSKLSLAVTTPPSKLKPGSKKAKRRLSFCRRMKGMKAKLTSAKTARDPDSRINKSLRKWNCEE